MGDAMTMAGVNALRDFGDRGHLVSGARTLASTRAAGSAQRYVPMRRLVDHVQRSVATGVSAAAFETNDARLWVRLRGEIQSFLGQLWRAGALQGAKPEEAYFVQCGLGQTMTEADVVAGTVTLRWGLAVSRPAEFVVTQVSFATGMFGKRTGVKDSHDRYANLEVDDVSRPSRRREPRKPSD